MINYVETLSLQQQFRLIEIAFETRDSAIRKHALAVLQNYLTPLQFASLPATPSFENLSK